MTQTDVNTPTAVQGGGGNGQGGGGRQGGVRAELRGVPQWVAVGTLVLWFLGLVWLGIFADNLTAEAWTRRLALLNALQAVAFAAAGALFGVQVQAQRVANAETRAEEARKEAATNRNDAVELATVVEAEADARMRPESPVDDGRPGPTARMLARAILRR